MTGKKGVIIVIKNITNYKNLPESEREYIKNKLKKVGIISAFGASSAILGLAVGYTKARNTFLNILDTVYKNNPEFDKDTFIDIWNKAVDSYFSK